MELTDAGALGVLAWILWKTIEKAIATKKNGNGSSVPADLKQIALDSWSDNKKRSDETHALLSHMTEKIDFLDHVSSVLDDKQLRVVWRDTAREKEDHDTLEKIHEDIIELTKIISVIDERTKKQ